MLARETIEDLWNDGNKVRDFNVVKVRTNDDGDKEMKLMPQADFVPRSMPRFSPALTGRLLTDLSYPTLSVCVCVCVC